MENRRKSKQITIGNVKIGGGAPISVQSMCNTDTRDIEATCRQIKELEAKGCEIVRLAVLNNEAADAIKEIVKKSTVPLVADIHFDYRLALTCIENGIHAIGGIGLNTLTITLVNLSKYLDQPAISPKLIPTIAAIISPRITLYKVSNMSVTNLPDVNRLINELNTSTGPGNVYDGKIIKTSAKIYQIIMRIIGSIILSNQLYVLSSCFI